MKNKQTKEFKLGELFCGPGGLALGAISARIDDPKYKIVHKWANDYDEDTIKKWLNKFMYRFFTQQIKRSALPDGPKVVSIT